MLDILPAVPPIVLPALAMLTPYSQLSSRATSMMMASIRTCGRTTSSFSTMSLMVGISFLDAKMRREFVPFIRDDLGLAKHRYVAAAGLDGPVHDAAQAILERLLRAHPGRARAEVMPRIWGLLGL